MKLANLLLVIGGFFVLSSVLMLLVFPATISEKLTGVFVYLAIGGPCLYFGIQRRQSKKIAETPRTISSSSSRTAAIEITTSPSTAWKPSQAVGLIAAIVRLREPTMLSIVATSRGISWHVELPEPMRETVTRTILSFYPQAGIQVLPRVNSFGAKSTALKGGLEYYAPLPFADELKSLDPLVGVVGAMANLRDSENVIYQVHLTPSQKNYNQEGHRKIHKSAWPIVMRALLDAADNRRVHVRTAPPSLDKYEARYQRTFEDKVNATLTPVEMSVFVKAPTQERFQTLLSATLTATSVFERDSGNFLISSGGHDLVLSPPEIAALWHLPTEQIQAPGVASSYAAAAPLPVDLFQQRGDMLLGHNSYQGQTRPVYIADQDRITHMNIVGKTRVGKTTFMHNLIHQDIAAGKGVAVIDPHGDLVRDILESSIPAEREADVVLFDLADRGHPAPLNLLYVPTGVARHAAVGLTLGVLKKMFGDQWSATRMEDALYSALAVLVDYQGATIRDIPKLFLNQDFRMDVLSKAHDEVALEYFYEDYEQMSERYQLEVARPIMNRIRAFYRNPVIRSIVDQPNSIDMRSIMDGKQIFLASLAGEATQAEASTIGALLISKIQMAAMSRASIEAERRRMFYLYIDEVQNFVTTSLPVMFSEAAKYALSLTVANQFLRQLAGGTLEAVLGNTGTTVMFACGSKDAKDLGAYVKPVFDSEALMNLDRFNTVVKMQKDGKTLPAFNMQTPEPPKKPEDAHEVAQRIREKALEAYMPAPAEEEEPTREPSAAELSDTPSDTDKGDIPTLEL